MKKHGLVIGLLACAAGCGLSSYAQTTQKLSAAKHNDYGIVYSLPTTHLTIEVEAQQTIKKAGAFYNYAKKYLGTDDVITEDSQSWELKGVRMYSYGIPDKNNEYLMQFKSGSTPFLMIAENGVPLALNTENVIESIEWKKNGTKTSSVLENNAFASVLPEELLMSESLAKRAEVAANMIYKIRESRSNYMTGEADQMPPDEGSLKLILTKLDEQEKTLMALFLGTTQTSTSVATFEYTPMDEVSDEVIFRISDFNGITDKEDLSGEPAYISVKILAKGEVPLDEKGKEKKLPKGAVMYKIPGKARVTVTYGGEKVCSENFDVAQFGVDYGLDPSMFMDKKAPAYIKFNPSTGGILELGTKEAESKSPSSEKEEEISIDGWFN